MKSLIKNKMNKELRYKATMLFLIGIAWLLYLVTNLINNGRQFYDVGLGIDGWIPFIPAFIFIYLIWWPLVWMPVFLSMKNKMLLKKVAIAFISLILISNIIFLAFPTKITRPEVSDNNITETLVKTFYRLDAPYNLFPSLHVSSLSLAFLIMYSIKKRLSLRLLPVFVLVLLSPLFIKQHYLLDVISGIILGSLVYYIVFFRVRIWQ